MGSNTNSGKFMSRKTAKIMANLKRVRIFLIICAVLGVASMGFALYHTAAKSAPAEPSVKAEQPVSHDEPIVRGDFTFKPYSGGYTLVSYNGSDSVVEVPALVNGAPVLRIDEDSFAGNIYIVSVIVPEYAESIGMGAFKNCSALLNVDFPDSLLSIGSNAFTGCAMLRYAKLPAYLTEISPSAFRGCADGFGLYVIEGTYGETYAKSNGYDYEYFSEEIVD